MPDPRHPEPESVESRRAQRHRQRLAAKRRRLILLLSGVIVAAAIATVVVVIARDDDAAEKDPAFLLVLDDYSITGSLIVPAGDVTFAVANVGEIPHNVGLRRGPITADLFPGRANRLQLLGIQPGTYELFCDIAGHKGRGMVASLLVTEPATVPVPTT